MNHIEKAKKMLIGWIKYSVKDLYICPERPNLICYGAGYNGWGMQTHQKALAAFATVATSNDIDTTEIGISKSELLNYSLKMLRYMLESHIEGSYECVEGDKWGHTWISALGTERAMHAIDLLEDYMTAEDKKLLEKVFVSEADWLLDCYDITAALEGASGKNKPESNIWNGSFLHRVAMMYPNCARADEYKQKGTLYLVNGISVSSDENSNAIYDGKHISDWYIGSNFFDSFSLDHHGYLNVGYMVICLSNIAMFYFSCIRKGIKPTEALYHHAEDLWKLIKSCMFDDGRLIRIGGDSRVRYCYCQDYALPMLTFVRDYFKDKDAINLESALVDLIYKEYVHNNNGSFLSNRCEGFKEISPIYYTRLESDKAAVLSMLVAWNSMAQAGDKKIERLTSWQENFHGACMYIGKRRFASWTCNGAEGTQGLCLPIGISNLAEWNDNLAGEIKGTGCINLTKPTFHEEKTFDGGFLAFGIYDRESKKFLAEQQKDEVTAQEKITYAALPDDATVVVMQYAKTLQRVYIKTIKGINCNIPNDVYNDFKRTYHFKDMELIKEGLKDNEGVINTDSNWLNVDNTLGVIKGYGQDKLKIYRPGKRQISIKKAQNSDNLYNSKTQNLWSDVICGKCDIQPKWSDKNEVILDEGAIVIAGIDAKSTRQKADFVSDIKISYSENIRTIITQGEDGKTYIVISNFGNNDQDITIDAKKYNLKSIVYNKVYISTVKISKNSADLIIAE